MNRIERLAVLASDTESEEEVHDQVDKRKREKQDWIEWESFDVEADALDFLASHGFVKHSINKADVNTGRKVK